MDLYNGFDSNYRYILVAARRARQLQSGASPLIATDSTKPCHIAALELLADKVQWATTPLVSALKPDVNPIAQPSFKRTMKMRADCGGSPRPQSFACLSHRIQQKIDPTD